MFRPFFQIARLAVAAALCYGPAAAAERTFFSTVMNLECAVNAAGGVLRTEPNLKAKALKSLPDLTPVKIVGGTHKGVAVEWPNTDKEWSYFWFQVADPKSGKTMGWVPAGSVNCGG